MTCGLGFKRSEGWNGMPISLIHDAISLSDYDASVSMFIMLEYGATDQAHEIGRVLLFLLDPALLLL